jgi:hypothetical protein
MVTEAVQFDATRGLSGSRDIGKLAPRVASIVIRLYATPLGNNHFVSGQYCSVHRGEARVACQEWLFPGGYSDG